jgi:hypothetical protein
VLPRLPSHAVCPEETKIIETVACRNVVYEVICEIQIKLSVLSEFRSKKGGSYESRQKYSVVGPYR